MADTSSPVPRRNRSPGARPLLPADMAAARHRIRLAVLAERGELEGLVRDGKIDAGTKAPEGEWERCKDDLIHFINAHCWCYEPRERSYFKLTLLPKQEEFLRWLEARVAAKEYGLVEKCRDCGFTWCCVYYAIHAWLFFPGFSAGFVSAQLDLVDQKGNPDAIFEKLRFAYYRLPEWMRPSGFRPEEHDKLGVFINPATGSTITGDGGREAGRGGRKGIVFVDEAASIPYPESVDMALSRTTDVRIDGSTPKGMGNPFARKRHSGALPVFVFDWRDDPRYNRKETLPDGREVYPWYEDQCKKLQDPVLIAQELDRDYTASVEGVCIPSKWVRAAVDLHLRYEAIRARRRRGEEGEGQSDRSDVSDWSDARLSDSPVSDARPLGARTASAGWDVGGRAANSNVLALREGPTITHVEQWGKMNTTRSTHRAIERCTELRASILSYDATGLGEGPQGVFENAEDGEVASGRGQSDSGRSDWSDPSDRSDARGSDAPDSDTPLLDMDAALPFETNAVLPGNPPSDCIWPSGKTSREMFANLRTELAWLLRLRFEKSCEFVEGDADHPFDEMISIPNHPDLIAQLSMPTIDRTNTGKWRLEQKQAMKRRGITSPHYFDALCFAFADDVQTIHVIDDW